MKKKRFSKRIEDFTIQSMVTAILTYFVWIPVGLILFVAIYPNLYSALMHFLGIGVLMPVIVMVIYIFIMSCLHGLSLCFEERHYKDFEDLEDKTSDRPDYDPRREV